LILLKKLKVYAGMKIKIAEFLLTSPFIDFTTKKFNSLIFLKSSDYK